MEYRGVASDRSYLRKETISGLVSGSDARMRLEYKSKAENLGRQRQYSQSSPVSKLSTKSLWDTL